MEAYPDVNSACQPCDDSCLEFSEERYITNVAEDAGVDVLVELLEVTDRRRLGRPVQFAITAGNADRLFAVNSTSGAVTVAGSLDRETQEGHTLTVVAVDVGTNPFSAQSASAAVLVIVNDINDNPPVFSQQVYSAVVTENIPPDGGSPLVIIISATDIDSPPNAMVTYSLAAGEEGSGLFQLDPNTGEVFALVVLDFETQPVYNLTAIASDSGIPVLSSTAQIVVSVVDQNDVRPTFQQTEYSVPVSELLPPGSSVLQLEASDSDTGNITYELVSGNTGNAFEVDPSSGLLSTAIALDFELVREYQLRIVARDGFPNPLPSGTATVLVSILDENDNTPEFNQTSYRANIAENSPENTFVLAVAAFDLDSGDNSIISFSVAEDGFGAFFVDESTGSVSTLTSLDRESQSVYEFEIVATDQGTPQLSSSVAITIFVDDINDNAPVFTETFTAVNLTENHPVSSIIATFVASDSDAGSNADIRFSLMDETALPFSIDQQSGVISLELSLDYEQVTFYDIVVVASDLGFPPLTAPARLVVYVEDVNDNAPLFDQQVYSTAIPEDFGTETSILQVVSSDLDSGTNAAVTYQIVAGNSEGIFVIDGETGEISLANPVDFERQSLYNLTVSASNLQAELPLATTATVSITILETNEHVPVFSQNQYQASLLENEPSGTSVIVLQATDLDGGPSGQISFEILSGNTGGAFEIASNGTISTLRPLDREQQESYMLTVLARDGGIPQFSAAANVTVTVADANDNPPQFTFTVDYTAALTENSPQGTVVVTTPPLSASDADIGSNSDITYSIVAGDPDGFFTIDPLTAQLQSERSIDFEVVDRFELIISATDGGVPPLSSTATVIVDIVDTNDNPPSILQAPTEVVFTEGQDSLLIAPGISVSDPDSVPIRQVTVSLTGQPSDRLSVSSPPPNSQLSNQLLEFLGSFSAAEVTSLLRTLTFTNSQLEPSAESRSLQIMVSDGTFSDLAEITILIELVNDNNPEVDLDTASPGMGYEAVFTEEGAPVALTGPVVEISDPDSGAGGIVSVSVELLNPQDGRSEGLLIGSSDTLDVTFGEENHSIVIASSTVAPFTDFETLLATLFYFNEADEPSPTQRSVLVVASDGMLESEPALASVTIVLVNDAPRLDLGGNVDYQVEFVEGEGPVLLTSQLDFSLTDSDSTELQNASITLLNAPDGGDEGLGIDEDLSAFITITATQNFILLQGPAPLTDFAVLLRSVTYDNVLASPAADLRRVQFGVSDGSAVSLATTFVTFSLVNDPPIVDLNGPSQGTDFETEFFEGSSPILVASPQLAIRDVDSNFLHFATVNFFPVSDVNSEGLLLDSSLVVPPLQVTISPILIEIEGVATLEEYAAILQTVAYVNTADEPTGGLREVEFIVNDGEANSTLVRTAITVRPVNDAPELVINNGVDFGVSYIEETAAVSIVGSQSISLRDTDSAFLDSLLVTIQNVYDGGAEVLGFEDPSSDLSLVVIETNNLLLQQRVYTFRFSQSSSTLENFQTLIASLAYRNTASEPQPGVRELAISVSDGNATSVPQCATVNITLVNDNAPSFQQLIVQASVPENTFGISVATLSATDADSNMGPFASHGVVQYFIVGGNEAGFFEIDTDTGVLTLVSPQDRETSSAGAALSVEARNPAPLDDPSAFFPTSFVIVSILDQNDNAPVFINGPFQFSVLENVSSGHVVGIIEATDSDAGDNALVQYRISQGNVNSAFSIDSNTGVITVASSETLDREAVSSYILSVTATDGGDSPISNTTTVAIEILDVNDNLPVFSSGSYSASLSESAPIGVSVLTVFASDQDSGPGGVVSYRLEGTSLFSINVTTGVVTTTAELDRETQTTHSFVVTATDGGSPQLSTSVPIAVSISDENDEIPQFSQLSYSTSVLESFPIGQLVLVVSATDRDAGTNAQLSYFINGTAPFTIDQSSGAISVSQTLDRETADFYQFDVVVEDGGQPPLLNTASVSITITDVNDIAPVFAQPAYETEISENVPLLSPVITVSAEDIDQGSNGRIVYSLVDTGLGPGDNSDFQVDPSTGEVLTVGSIDREERAVYLLEVVATDQGTPALSSRAMLTVSISDQNDNLPVFSSPEYRFSVSESFEVGGSIGLVSATDADLGSNAEILFSILNQATLPFTINETTGELSTLFPLDRETTPSYNFTVLATDGGQPALSSTAAVQITVTDVNDFPPQFSQPLYAAEVPEDLSLASALLIVVAEDLDASSDTVVTYQIISGAAGVFSLTSQTGQLLLASSLDAETTSFYSLTVQARDDGTPPLSSTAVVEITVTDVNDNPVELILDAAATAVFTEESPPVTIAPSVLVQDSDITAVVVNATVELLETQECCEDRLILDTDSSNFPGVSVLVRNSDREVLIQGPVNTSTISMLLQSVQYQNTNPEPQGGMLVARFTVSDGLFSASRDAAIIVTLMNDNAPVVLLDGENLNSSATFVENSPGVLITGQVTIVDGDSDAEGLESISVTLLNPSDNMEEFLTAQLSGVVSIFPPSGGTTLQLNGPAPFADFVATLSTLQYHNSGENPSAPLERVVEVVANDGGLFSSPSYASITVVPVNDPPILQVGANTVNFSVIFVEGSQPVMITSNGLQISDPDSQTITDASVTLMDPADAGSEMLSFQPTESAPTFVTISPTDLRLSNPTPIANLALALRSIFYSNNATNPTLGDRTVRFIISDGELSASAFTEISVRTVNDPPTVDLNGPQPGRDYSTQFLEGGEAVNIAPPETLIEDSDDFNLASLTVRIVAPLDGASEFLIYTGEVVGDITAQFDAASGTMVLVGSATAEDYRNALLQVQYLNVADEPMGDERVLEVVANDGELNSDLANVIISFVRVNDPPEVILDSGGNFSTVYIENGPAVSVVNPLSAVIRDVDSATLAFLLIQVAGVLDGELESIEYSSPVGGLIEDVRYDTDTRTAYFNLSYPIPQSVGVYSNLLRSLSYQNLAPEPNASAPRSVSISTSDGQLGSSTAMATVSIQLVDDNQPLFEEDAYSFSVPENSAIGSTVGMLVASDADFGGVFLYQISPQEVPFSINSGTGVITVTEDLDREVQAAFSLTAVLTRTTPPFSQFDDQASITITIQDVNDVTPSFNQSSFSFEIPEDTPTGATIATLVAEDSDEGSNAALQYTLTETAAFSVESDTGALIVNDRDLIDRETVSVINFIVTVVDGGQPPLSSQAAVTVSILDVNDNAPMFSQASYFTRLVETTPVGFNILQLLASDPDFGSNAQIEFSLTPAIAQFTINSSSGVVSTQDTLTPRIYELTATVTDRGQPPLSSTANLTIEVISFDSTRPVFTQPSYEGSVSENLPSGTSVLTVIAIDPISSNPVVYSITSQSSEFTLDADTGVLRTGTSLDRESQSIYQFEIRATSTDGTREGFSQIIVTVLDDNDQQPVFSQPVYGFEVLENDPAGTIIGAVFARDLADLGSNAVVSGYSTSDANFSISSVGIVSTSTAFDRETQDQYTFEIFATDAGNPSQTGTSTVTVSVLDVNDNAPEFSQTVYEASVMEAQSSGASVLTVAASDLDLGVSGVVSFSTASAGFEVQPLSGVVSTTAVLDFEQTAEFEVVIVASDGGLAPLVSSATVLVSVLDIDDARPRFTMDEFSVSVLEEQSPSVIVTVRAFDNDSSPDNPIAYAIVSESNALFTIDQNGSIATLSPLDRESASQHTLTVQASNFDAFGATLSSTATVSIEVLDVNDQMPQFIGLPYIFSIAEDADGGDILETLAVTDADVGSNANVSAFRIVSGDPETIFTINPQSGTLRLADSAEPPLDRELQDSYVLTVEVTDGGTPQLSSSAAVSIIVTDTNDQSPVFDRQLYNATLPEDTAIETTFLTVSASDADIGTNSDVTFFLLEPSTQFAVHPETGSVTLLASLDFRVQQLYMLTLTAVDGGTPALTGSATLQIEVADVDNLPVVFEPDTYSVSVFENTPFGTFVATVTAQDADTVSSNPITYQLGEQQQQALPFAVDVLSGDLTVAGSLDREDVELYTFVVLASNLPGMFATATVTVQVMDLNDVTPSFPNGPFQFQISESTPIQTVLDQIAAIDADLGSAGIIVGYGMETGVPEFDIGTTSGVLTVAASLDFEQTQLYNFTIFANDGGTPSLTGTTEVVVMVTDANDNSPQFAMTSFNTTVPENEPVGSVVFTASATDADMGTNALVTYSLSPASAPFAIEPTTGAVNITSPLTVQTYTLQLMATDMGTPPLISMATLVVTVTDANERPSFTQSLYTAMLGEDTEVGNSILQVLALDPDTGSNANISYSILPASEPEDVFTISVTSGEITLALSLDFEQVITYSRTLIATDSGTPPLSTSATLTVSVTDVNDNPPQFTQDSYAASVPEDILPGSMILTVTATDADSSSNAAVTYSLAGGSTDFEVDPTNGSISTLRLLDFETTQSVELTVIARDGGQPVMSSSVQVTVSITDIDDNRPIFTQALYTANITEDSAPGTVILTVIASDSDSGGNSAVEYSLLNSSVPFAVDSETGNLTLTAPGLDRESVERYQFLVQASNPNSALFSATATVEITVEDVNDNPPQFDPASLEVSVAESTPIGFTIGSVIAADADTGSNAAISYSINTGPFSSSVAIDAATGDLITSDTLDFESMPLVELTVVATDSGNPPLSTNATLTLRVQDINDVPPVVSISQSQFTFQEGSDAINVGTGIGISDPDGFPLAGATVELFSPGRNPASAGDFILLDRASSESQGLTLTASPDFINITGAASVTTYTAVLAQLQFGSTAAEPDEGEREIQLQVSDGQFDSNVASIFVMVDLVNDNPPMLDLSVGTEGLGFQATFTEEGLFVFLVAQDASLTDADGDVIQSVAITITNPLDGSQEQLSAFALVRGVTVETVNSSAIVLTGPALVSDFEFVLQTISYINLADEPRDVQTARIVAFEASDGVFNSPPALTTVIIQPVNDPPVIRLGVTQDVVLVYSETVGSLTLVSEAFTLSDDDSDLLSFVNITILNFQPGIDRFDSSTVGTSIVAEFLVGTLLLTGPASLADFLSVLRTVTYINGYVESDQFDQLVGGRTIQFTAHDGSNPSQVASAFVTFSAVNDPPLVDLNGPDAGSGFSAIFEEGNATVSAVSPLLTVTDVDSEFLLSATAQLSGTLDQLSESLLVTDAAGISFAFDPFTGTLSLSGSATVSQYQQALRSLVYQNLAPEPTPGIRSIDVIVSDGEAPSISTTSTITVLSFNDPPDLSLDPAGEPFIEDGGAVPLVNAASVMLLDSDNTTLALLEVTIRNADDGFAEVINTSMALDGLTSNTQFSAGSLTFTFSFSLLSQGSIAQFSDLISSLTYTNTAPEPTNAPRVIDITISDGVGRSSPVTVTLEIVLINENPPVFADASIQLQLPESLPLQSSIFQATATDVDTNSVITYALLLNTSERFNIAESTGEITLTDSLDRETEASITLEVEATDGTNSATLQISIQITDENDNAPVFSSEVYATDIAETTLLGSPVIQVFASDEDAGSNSEIRYAIRGGNQEGVFNVNMTSGEIETVRTLDFESTESYSLVVVAQDSGVPSLTATSFVIVTVVDENDNSPVFNPATAQITVLEDTMSGSNVFTAQATDLDADSQISYSLLNGSELFSIAADTGAVTVIATLDRETTALHQVAITATDTRFVAVLQLTVQVGDVDDNAPTFSQNTYLLNVSEATDIGEVLLQLVVSDPDLGDNAAAIFEIVSGDPLSQFTVNTNTGQLLLAGGLDREQQSEYELVVTAQSPSDSTLNDIAMVRITVEDENDSRPQFTSDLYQFSVLENATEGSDVGMVLAIDMDSGPGGAVTYTISMGDSADRFSIADTGVLTVGQLLDRENTTQYALTVVAQDGGFPVLSATTSVIITVGDVNDNAPRFFESSISVSLQENSPPDSVLVTASALDADIGSNAQVVYSLSPSDGSFFEINSESGVLVTRATLDFEADPTDFLLTVLATDGGSPPLSSEQSVSVTLLDQNEFAPEFEASEFTVEISEDVAVLSTVLQISASDSDGGIAGVVMYSLLQPSDSLPFAIDNATGDIYTTAALDRETVTSYQFTVQASNPLVSPSLPSLATVTVLLLDVNDNQPMFGNGPFLAVVFTDVAVSTVVLTVGATDEDLGTNAEVRYSISDPSGQFGISELTGTISVAAALNQTGDFTVTVTATDLGVSPLSSTVTTTISVLQAVPTPVQFLQEGAGFLLRGGTSVSQEFGLFSDAPPGSVGTIAAMLGPLSTEMSYSTALPEAVSVRGVVLNEDAWPDQPDVRAIIQVLSAEGDVHCTSTDVVIRVLPSAPLQSLANVIPQVCARVCIP